ncbi:hypothetical protein TUM4261_33080 [Shewanella sp. c952]|uniref:hypothetical protein n=1 Tax=Shewanella sp. c952 TaxID=2815913 RepID=UPI001BBBA303|nr:hypothetical protein [Shewanella sp. c952]GIU15685.1 hypothetical protein TUM4261_33080 [Shewanella sp. c952]
MILTKVQKTPKQRTEFRLLVAIRFACLMARAQGITQPLQCQRVQSRVHKLIKHLDYYSPSQAFRQQHINHAGELGHQFSLRYIESKGDKAGTVGIFSNNQTSNVYQLENSIA